MSGLNGTVTIQDSQYRPCFAKGQRALFHKWEDNSEIYAPSLMVGGHACGVVKYTCAIVEYEDGHVERVKPEDVMFADNLIKEYAFPEYGESEQPAKEDEKPCFTEEKIQCPFCGGDNKNAVVWTDEQQKEHFVYCRMCGIETIDVFKTRNAAIKAFRDGKNKRISEGGMKK